MPDRIKLDLALQGGGAHGAFTWGVLDRLLDEEWIEIDGVSGASAGAMNGVVLAHGLVCGGRSSAKESLEKFWREVARLASGASPSGAACALMNSAAPWDTVFSSAPSRAPFDPFSAFTTATMQFWSAMSAYVSPYQANPFNWNPLLELIGEMVDFDALNGDKAPRLYISATRVCDGGVKLFRNHELSAHAVMASACLPDLFQAVEIDGAAYWDGGFVANPALEPLIEETTADDLLLIQLNPTKSAGTPRTASEISSRVNEITFNANLTLSMHGLAQLKSALDEEACLNNHFFGRLRTLNFHRIDADHAGFAQEALAKRDARWPYLRQLHDDGAKAADEWLRDNRAQIGNTSTIDFRYL